MARGSRNRRRAALSKARRTRNAFGWYVVAGVIIVVGVVLIVMSQTDDEEPTLDDHWHAAFGVNVCGEWLPDVPTFDQAADDPSIVPGIHSHGDGLIHIHPHASGETGDRATVGKFLDYAGYSADEDSFMMTDNQVHRTGDECDGEPAKVRWSVNGEERDGDISDYRPQDQDVIALALLPEDAEIPTPPSAGRAPTDLAPSETAPGAVDTPTTVAAAPDTGTTDTTTADTTTADTAAP